MRIGVVWDPDGAGINYRATSPSHAVGQCGHEIVLPPVDGRDAGWLPPETLASCDVVLVYRRFDDRTIAVLRRLARQGVGVVYDNDDDYRAIPKDAPGYRQLVGGPTMGAFGQILKMAKLATVVTATSQPIADRYREYGVEGPIEVIPNMLLEGTVRPHGVPHGSVVVGWVAGWNHDTDAERLGIAEALGRVLGKHEDVTVECIGVNLRLPERYRHQRFVPFGQLSQRIAGFDIGIAPLADTPFNRARSDIKVKEYAARGVPWLASPVTPYLPLGELEGGRLVEDGGWFDAIDRLVRKHRERRRLSEAALAWAGRSTIQRTASHWEDVLLAAAEAARAQQGAGRAAAGR
jgi:glycosyltransferase involved in cell wall biosynthesis